MTYRDRIADMRDELRGMHKLIPETMQGFTTLSRAAMDTGTLGVKDKEFIALAISIALRCEPCIAFHIEALIKLGATREELGCVLAMSIQMGGGPSVMYAGHALGCWDELTSATH